MRKTTSKKKAKIKSKSITASTQPLARWGRTKIFIIDDHPIVRRGIAGIINREHDLTVCGEAENLEKAIESIESVKPDFLLLDVSINGSCQGINFLKVIKKRWPNLPVLILSMHEEVLYAESALREGAKGYIMKQEASEKILIAIRTILAGQIYLSENMRERVLEKQYSGGSVGVSPQEVLSKRELEVFRLIGEGLTTAAIAKKLERSVKTIETYRARIKDKLNLKHNMELIRCAVHSPIDLSQIEAVSK